MISNFAVMTYHKTGTVLMGSILIEFSEKNNLRLIKNFHVDNNYELKDKEIFLDSTGYLNLKNNQNVVGFRVVRNPRDIIISAARYHSISTIRPHENWLYEKNNKNISYNEKIRSITNFEDRLIFEMNNYSKNEIEKIINFKNNKIMTVKYEDFVSLNEKTFYRISKLLRFNKKELNDFILACKNHHYSKHIKNNNHINNGKTNQYLDIWNQKLENELYDIFGEKLKKFEKKYEYKSYFGDQ